MNQAAHLPAIEWLKEIPRRNADRMFLVDGISGETLTFDQFFRSACAIGADLRATKGLQKGGRVAIILQNSRAFAKLYLGCLYAGLVVVPINPILSVSEKAYIIEHSRAGCLVVSPETKSHIAGLPESLKNILTLTIQDTADKAGEGIWDVSRLTLPPDFSPLADATESDDLVIAYTSGTTASPKGVVHRIANMVDNARCFGREVGIGPENRFYNNFAMTYMAGYYNLLLLPYICEGSVVIAPTFNAASAVNYWKMPMQYEVNTLWLVPMMVSILMEMDRGKQGESYCRKNVRCSFVGTAPLAAQLRLQFEERYGVRLLEDYGLSETLFISTQTPSSPSTHNQGKVLPTIEVKIGDPNANEFPVPGTAGEIFVKTPYLMKGYYDSKTGKPDLMPGDHWFSTGDIGILTADNEVLITGRKKDLIIRGGINISPAHIEEVIRRCAGVMECAVVGVPHKILGEDIVAVIGLSASYEFKTVQGEIAQLCRSALSQVEQPARIIELAEFPRTHSGKVQKAKIREWLQGLTGGYK